MGFGDGLNWMIEKLKQSAPDMTAVAKAYQSSYDLGLYACSKISDGAEKLMKLRYCPDSQSAVKAATYMGDMVISESVRGLSGELIIRRVLRDGLYSLIGRVRSYVLEDEGRIRSHIDADATEEELKGMIEKQEANEVEILLCEQSKLFCEMMRRIEKLEEDNHMLMERIEKLEYDNELLRRELCK